MAIRRKNNKGNRRTEPKFEFRINQMIRIPEVRLVGDNLEEVSKVAGRTVESGVYNTRQLQNWAQELGLDLVEISPKADPPVVRIIKYNKFLYDKKKERKRNPI